MTLYWIKGPYFCAGILAKNGMVKQSAPILHWTRGKRLGYVLNRFKSLNYEVKEIG